MISEWILCQNVITWCLLFMLQVSLVIENISLKTQVLNANVNSH